MGEERHGRAAALGRGAGRAGPVLPRQLWRFVQEARGLHGDGTRIGGSRWQLAAATAGWASRRGRLDATEEGWDRCGVD